MKRKFLATTLLSMSVLSLNLAAAGKMNCTGSYCVVDISKKSPKKVEVKSQNREGEYETVLIDNIETIILPPSKYVMTQLEIAEYDLDQMQKYLLVPALNSTNLPNSDDLCEDNLKAVQVVGIENTYECT